MKPGATTNPAASMVVRPVRGAVEIATIFRPLIPMIPDLVKAGLRIEHSSVGDDEIESLTG